MKKVKGTLVGVNGNAFALMGHFQKLARKQGFEKDWIKDILDKAQSGDYNHLVATLANEMEDDPDESDEDYGLGDDDE